MNGFAQDRKNILHSFLYKHNMLGNGQSYTHTHKYKNTHTHIHVHTQSQLCRRDMEHKYDIKLPLIVRLQF